MKNVSETSIKKCEGKAIQGEGKGDGEEARGSFCPHSFPLLFPTLHFPAYISDALHDLVPFVQFKKHEKHPWRNDTFSKLAG